MRTVVRTMMWAVPLFALALPALAQKPRKANAVVTVSTPATVAPVARVAVSAPPPVLPAPPVARVAVVHPAPVVTVAAPPPVVMYGVPEPTVAVQMQVSAEGGYVASGPMPGAEVQVVQPTPTCAFRSDGEQQAVVAAIKHESFSSDQLRVLGDAAQGSCFSVAQVEQIIPLFSFEADQLKALQMMAQRIVDRQNTFRIYGLFTFESGKQQARRILSH